MTDLQMETDCKCVFRFHFYTFRLCLSSNITLLNEYLILKHICSESVYILGVGFGVLVKRTMCENRKKNHSNHATRTYTCP